MTTPGPMDSEFYTTTLIVLALSTVTIGTVEHRLSAAREKARIVGGHQVGKDDREDGRTPLDEGNAKSFRLNYLLVSAD
jgi:hypothetical protein